MKKYRHLRGTLFDIERQLRTRNSGADEAISEAFVKESAAAPAPPAEARGIGRRGSNESLTSLTGQRFFSQAHTGGANWLTRLIAYDNNWNSRPINKLFIPGSHDALIPISETESTKIFLRNQFMKRFGSTQYHKIDLQLNNGYRYFDIRLGNASNGYRGVHTPLKGFGAYGSNWKETLGSCYQFLEENPREFIILRVDKSENGFETELIEQEIETRKRHPHGRLYSDLSGRDENLATTPINQVIGKIVILTNNEITIPDKDSTHEKDSYQKCFKKFLNLKLKDMQKLDADEKGIMLEEFKSGTVTKIFGGYANTDVGTNVLSHMRNVATYIKGARDYFLQLSWQVTLGPKYVTSGSIEEQTHQQLWTAASIEQAIQLLTEARNQGNGSLFTHDFVNGVTGSMIYEMNFGANPNVASIERELKEIINYSDDYK